ncbi:MAG: PQQ-binding-like beta-propeller repeat protein [Lentisphaerae bacterium]|nr:PQQ-binding-like beta-propeller repeat protein [Lentisphaerota bacterium]
MNKRWMGAILGCAVVATSFAEDWPQFCGPNRNNISTETGLADSWPEGGPKVLWEKTVSDGYSSPAIKDGKVYFADRDGNKSVLLCMDLNSGTNLWKCAIEDPGTMSHQQYAGTRGTPTVTDDAVYLVTAWGTMLCVDLESKSVRWKHNLLEEYGMSLHMWGMSQSPLIYKDLVIVVPSAESAGVVAYNRKDGAVVWKSKSIGGYSFASPALYTICGKEMILAVGSQAGGGFGGGGGGRGRGRPGAAPQAASTTASSGVFGLSPEDGSVLWSYTGWQCGNAIPFPITISDDRVFMTGGYNAGSAMFRVEKTDEGYKTTELFKNSIIGPQLHQPIYFDDRILVVNTDNSLNDGLACFKLDGTMVWRTKDIAGGPTFERGGFIIADGKIILLDAKTGKLHLAKADVSGYHELASAPMVKKNDMAWAPLTLSNGKLIVRDWTTMKCVDLK